MAVINNFVDIEDVKYYAKKQPFEENPKLPRAMVEPLHRLVMTVNIMLTRLRINLDRELYIFKSFFSRIYNEFIDNFFRLIPSPGVFRV